MDNNRTGFVNKISATAVITTLSSLLKILGTGINAASSSMGLWGCHCITKVLLAAIPRYFQMLARKALGKILPRYGSHCKAAGTHFQAKNQICHRSHYAPVWYYSSVSFPIYDVLFQLWQDFRSSSSGYLTEKPWYILMQRSKSVNEATVYALCQSHLYEEGNSPRQTFCKHSSMFWDWDRCTVDVIRIECVDAT